MIYQNKALPMKYKVINKKSISRDDIINENWNEYFIDEGRYQLKEGYDIYIKAKMAGAQDLKEPEDWMKEIHP